MQHWKPFFDPYLEEIKWVDLWVRIPRLPTELLNFDSIANLLAANDIGDLIKLDQSSILKNKIRFARACVRVNIQGPLLEFVEVCRVGDLVHGYVIWYEDFSSSCSLCGEVAHEIDVCPLLNSPKNEIIVKLLKNPKQKDLFHFMAKASGQDIHESTAEQSNVVHVQSKHFKKSFPNPKLFVLPSHKNVDSAGILPTPGQKGIVIKDHAASGPTSEVGKLHPPPMHGKGKGKLLVVNPVISDDSVSDDATILAPLVPLHLPMPAGQESEHAGESLSPFFSPAPLRVFCPSELLSESELKAHQGFVDHGLDDMGSGKNEDTIHIW